MIVLNKRRSNSTLCFGLIDFISFKFFFGTLPVLVLTTLGTLFQSRILDSENQLSFDILFKPQCLVSMLPNP